MMFWTLHTLIFVGYGLVGIVTVRAVPNIPKIDPYLFLPRTFISIIIKMMEHKLSAAKLYRIQIRNLNACIVRQWRIHG